jgi:hypothetical protein
MSRIHVFTHNRQDADETEVVVEYTYSHGYPECGPTYDCGGTPAEPAEIEIVKVTSAGVAIIPTDAEIEAWETYALENHEDDGPDPDYLRDLRMDEMMCRGQG